MHIKYRKHNLAVTRLIKKISLIYKFTQNPKDRDRIEYLKTQIKK